MSKLRHMRNELERKNKERCSICACNTTMIMCLSLQMLVSQEVQCAKIMYIVEVIKSLLCLLYNLSDTPPSRQALLVFVLLVLLLNSWRETSEMKKYEVYYVQGGTARWHCLSIVPFAANAI